MSVKKECEGCDGSGIRVPASPSCMFPPEIEAEGWIIAEKCDTCETFDSDEAAAKSYFTESKEVLCLNGALHSVGRSPR